MVTEEDLNRVVQGPDAELMGRDVRYMITQDQINKLTEVMERAKDPDFKEIWRHKIDYFYVKHVEESVRKEGLK